MSEKTYSISFPVGSCVTAAQNLTLQQIADMEAQCKAIREQAEAEKPRQGDVGKAADGSIVVFNGHNWRRLCGTVGDEAQRISYNIYDLQYPLVIGLTEEEAEYLIQRFRPVVPIELEGAVYDKAVQALQRYRENTK